MMRLMRKGQPAVFQHYCANDEYGKPMGLGEQRLFLTSILKDCFEECGGNVTYLHHAPGRLYPDLRETEAFGKGSVTIDYLILPGKTQLSEHDQNLLTEMYDGTDIILKVMHGSLWCFETSGQELIMGGSFAAIFNPQTIFPVIENEPLDKILSQKELTEKVLQSWINLDASIMEPYFDKDMHYKSDWVFNEMSSSLEYSAYIEHKFDAIRNSQSKFTLGFGANTQTGEYAMLIKQPSVSQSTNVMQVKTKNGRITFLHLAELKRN